MRVTHIITGLTADGAQGVLSGIISSGGKSSTTPGIMDHQVISLTEDGPAGESMRRAGAKVTVLGMNRAIPNPALFFRLSQMIRRSRPDVVQTWMYHSDLIGGFSARLATSCPIVWNIRHGVPDSKSDKRSTMLIAKTCASISHFAPPASIVCCSHAARAAHEAIGYKSSLFEVIPNGFDTSRFQPDPLARAALRKSLAVDEDVPLVGIVGRYHPVKDHDTFLLAASQLHAIFGRVQFVLCGKDLDHHNAALMEKVRDAGLQSACHLLGHRNDIETVFAAIDVAVTSSRVEAFPNAVAEAMACGLPCAATDVGDAAQIIGQTGMCTPIGDSAALAQSMAILLNMPATGRKTLGHQARERIQREFSLERMVREYQDLYIRLQNYSRRKSDQFADTLQN